MKYVLETVPAIVGFVAGALFTALMNMWLENRKAGLQRLGHIHERQVTALLAIHSNLDQALFYAQRATSAAKFAGETDQKLIEGFVQNLANASKAVTDNSLLFDDALNATLYKYFTKCAELNIGAGVFFDPATQGQAKAKIWTDMQQTAYKDLPPLLDAIRVSARRTIHG
jgi:hypothetical protein